MTDQALQAALGRWLRRQLEHGIVIGDGVRDYLASTFGTQDLTAVLADEDAGEIDSLLELLFYPDTDLQMKYEARWGRETFTESDRDTVVDALCAERPTARLTLPDNHAKLSMAVPAFACRTFVHRLNICRRLPAQLTQTLDQSPMDDTSLMIRVQLRNARLAWRDDQVALMQQFLTRMPAPSQTYAPDLDFLISILPELAEGKEAYAFLAGKKFFYFKSLCRAEDFERKRMTSNMEIMMMRGERCAHGSIDQWRQLMRRTDRICRVLFGRTEFFQQPDSPSIDLQQEGRLQDVIHKLS